MEQLLNQAEELINAGQYNDAVELLCRQGVPQETRVFELIALAHHKKDYARGDVYSAVIFAGRAISSGSTNPLMQEIINASKRPDKDFDGHLNPQDYTLGGWQESRPSVDAPLASNALSKLNGSADAPKDFDWLGKNIPCQKACPAATDIPGYLQAIYEGRHADAYDINLRDNVFPAVLGRVCARPCESECRHGWEDLGDPVAICFSKRSASDFKDQDLVLMDKWFDDSGKSVAVVGSGVAGLAAARQLALLGHKVTVYEKHNTPGGMMNQGIPVFRLPRDLIDKEVEQITALGVEIICNTEIGKEITLSQLTEQNDAVVMAAGTLLPNLLDLPGKELEGIRHGLDFLLEVNDTGSTEIGDKVVVIGGGFTAMDCARTARRLGATTVQIEEEKASKVVSGSILRVPKGNVGVWYRRSTDEMLVTPGEIEELEHEHIPLETMVTPKAYVGENGKVTAMQFIRTELGAPDNSGRRRPVEIAGSEFELPVDTVLLATGQFPETNWIDDALKSELVEEDGWLKSGSAYSTARDKIFVAGDFATGASSLIQAIGHAKDSVRAVDQFLTGKTRLKDIAKIEDVTDSGRIREMDAVPLQPMPTIELEKRDLSTEVELGFDKETSVDETQRCYQCHYKYEIDSDKCIFCDWCVKAKPRPDCILKVKALKQDDEGRIVGWEIAEKQEDVNMIWINQEDCIRCGACVAACPVDAISIQKVSLVTEPVT
jgi:NADPH-dependent glutamate synthase beta subunit-like oxidoreductase/ferredoxin